MALGDIHRDSDFDVIVACREDRLFTARFFCLLFFDFFGWRRPRRGAPARFRDKVCFNHFVTPTSFRLSPPHNLYWRELYLNLVPVYGPPEKINGFFKANADWMKKERIFYDDLRHQFADFANPGEKLLRGRLGDRLERLLGRLQLAKIQKGLRRSPPGYEPRLVINNKELEFHPDTYRIKHKLKSLSADVD